MADALLPRSTHPAHRGDPSPATPVTHLPALRRSDKAGLNIFFHRTAFPGLSIEYKQDWAERASINEGGHALVETVLESGQCPRTVCVLVMDCVVLGDRAAWEGSPRSVKNPEHNYPLVVSRHLWAPVRRTVVAGRGTSPALARPSSAQSPRAGQRREIDRSLHMSIDRVPFVDYSIRIMI